MLVSIFTLEFFSLSNLLETYPILKNIFGSDNINLQINNALLLLIIIFAINFVIKFSLLTYDSWLIARLRRKIQEKVFYLYLSSDFLSLI